MRRPFFILPILFSALLLLSACAPAATSTPFIPPAPPVESSPTTLPSPIPAEATPTSSPAAETPTAAPEATIEPTVEGPCTNGLSFLQDLTVPDGSIVQPGATIEKEWLVTNSGSCNWDSAYRFKFVGGVLLGANSEQALYPARAGTQATLRITFVAPLESGAYQSAWQAFAPDGTPFGDAVYMTINVGF